jgi:hypothetical protein
MEYHEAFGRDIHFCKDSQEQNSTPFIHGTEHMKSERLKAVPQSEFGNLPNFYKSVKEN